LISTTICTGARRPGHPMSGLQQTGILNVQWGKSAAQQCNASFTLPTREGKASGIRQIETICR
ncbi:FimD/PapC C-terminal domain-containing protein, partial [Klebsiella pneumoniae]|uniref:FimD/PapC C-terminal domain-containing protein n=1 Tax=Klebsiella pneumoniae TaxID=573 RepID=UPI003967F109